ncbi:dienelactone hydrolase [Xylogone sp. PMI_703]|nr:dienelactone hydrolase [Xylogone sp. PMI_703]
MSAYSRGTPAGKTIKIDGRRDAYLATPAAGKEHKDAGVLLIPDVFGIWQNNQLIADQFAANGYTTLIPDIFNGDSLSIDIDPVYPVEFDIMGWLGKGRNGAGPHTPDEIDPITVDAIKYLKDVMGVKRLGAVGYCLGAKYVIRNFCNGIDAGYVAHPSFVEEHELAAITSPLAIAAAETDPVFTVEQRHKSEAILQKTSYPYQISLYSGVVHGFASRADASTKVQKFAKEQAFMQAVQWFDTWLLGRDSSL